MNPNLDRQPGRDRWPTQADTPLQRARRIAIAYREHLRTANRDVCDALDDMARDFGESWVCGQAITVNLDDMLLTADAADLAGVDVETVRQWRKRGYISRSGQRVYLQVSGQAPSGQPMFRAADILEIVATTRQRRLRRPPP